MPLCRRPLATALLSVCLSALVVAQTPRVPALDVRMGLWEMTSTADVGGQTTGVDTSKMTPQQQAQIAGAMRGMMAPQTTTTTTCLTRAVFNRKNFMTHTDPTCRQTLTKNTKTRLEGRITCGGNTMRGTMHFDAPTPTEFSGAIKSTSTERGRTTTTNITMAGKWLAAECKTGQ